MPLFQTLIISLVCIGLFACEAPPDERELTCTRAIAGIQETLDQTPAERPRDVEKLRRLKEKQDKLISENRKKGVSECQIYQLVFSAAFDQ